MTTVGTPSARKGYLDWLRGAAVILMIQGHAVDSWTRISDKPQAAYGWLSMTWGIAAPLFLFLAGVALVLAAGGRLRKGCGAAEAAALARRRALQIFGLAFLFRLQAWLISGGTAYTTLLKVDILNVMGLAMLAAAMLWGLGRDSRDRALLLAAAAVAVAMATPIVRASAVPAPLPDPIEWYLRPFPGTTTFTLLPWAGFLLAGGATGFWIDSARSLRDERLVNIGLAVVGFSMALGGYAASFLPPIYEQTNYWTSSPTYFFVRLGIVIFLVPVAYLLNAAGPRLWRSAMQDFGRSSLFVYWIHVEMAYGTLSAVIHRRLSLELALLGWALLTALMFALVRVKQKLERDQVGHLGYYRAAQQLARALVPSFIVDKEEIAQRTVNDVKPQV